MTTQTSSAIDLRPPVATNHAGEPRRVGIEMELSGLDLEDLSRIVCDRFGGYIEPISAYEELVVGSELGSFRIELDFQYLKDLGRENDRAAGIAGELKRASEDAVAEIARQLVPFEIVSPPLAIDDIARIDELVDSLRRHGGRGTRHSPVYAFGLHLNPEVPSLDTSALLRYLRAFLCLHDWLIEVEQVDWSRRLTSYINPFPTDYVRLVTAADYAPDRERMIDDYLEYNADRNRSLDLLPLLSYLDAPRVRRRIDDPRIHARPTFHYRLPNCDVDIDGWSVTRSWANWLQVERLAEDRVAIEDISRAYLEHLDDGFSALIDDWSDRCKQWLK